MSNNNASVQNTKEFKNLEKIMDALYGKNPPREMPAQDRNSKTVVESLVQGGIRTTSVSLRPTKKLTELDKLEAILSF